MVDPYDPDQRGITPDQSLASSPEFSLARSARFRISAFAPATRPHVVATQTSATMPNHPGNTLSSTPPWAAVHPSAQAHQIATACKVDSQIVRRTNPRTITKALSAPSTAPGGPGKTRVATYHRETKSEPVRAGESTDGMEDALERAAGAPATSAEKSACRQQRWRCRPQLWRTDCAYLPD